MINDKHNGFTLVELLTSIAIILILTAVAIGISQGRSKGLVLNRTAALVSTKAELVKEKALSSQEFHGAIPKGGYGVYFNLSTPTKFILFADCDGNYVYSKGTKPCSGNNSEKIEEIQLEKGIKIKSIIPSNPLNAISITFQPPSPAVSFYISPGNKVSNSSVKITLEISGNFSRTKSIIFNKAGLIYIQ